MEKNGAVGVVDGYTKRFAWVNGKKFDANLYSVNGNTYDRADLAIEEDVVEFVDVDGDPFNRVIEAIDTDHETVLFDDIKNPVKAKEIYYCNICDGIHIFGIDDGAVLAPNVDKDSDENKDDTDFSLSFMFGYLEAVEDVNDYIHTDNCLWDKAIDSIDGVDSIFSLVKERRDKLVEFYNKVMELKNLAESDTEQTDEKPELTLDEIREKLGYDFTLVD
jgi:hypothetical protein